SLIGGWIELPPFLGNLPLFSDVVQQSLPPTRIIHDAGRLELILELFAAAASLSGIYVAYLLFLRHPHWLGMLTRALSLEPLHRFLRAGWGFDWLYDRMFVRPYLWLARVDQHDVIDGVYASAARFCLFLYHRLSATQTGELRRYAMAIAAGSIVVVFVAVSA
ncbi:MAG: NADH-quinone oxidoreductase subunit L, partial [Nitrosospira sp.]